MGIGWPVDEARYCVCDFCDEPCAEWLALPLALAWDVGEGLVVGGDRLRTPSPTLLEAEPLTPTAVDLGSLLDAFEELLEAGGPSGVLDSLSAVGALAIIGR